MSKTILEYSFYPLEISTVRFDLVVFGWAGGGCCDISTMYVLTSIEKGRKQYLNI